MDKTILYVLLSIIAACLIAIVYFFFKLSKTDESEDIPLMDNQPQVSTLENAKSTSHKDSGAIPDDVVFDDRNLPVRTSRSRKRKVNYGKDFNAYLVKGGTIYHKKSCKRLTGKKVVTKHIYECIADKNKRACPYCKPRTEIHEWYKAKFPDSVYVKAIIHSEKSEQTALSDEVKNEVAE